MSVYRCNRCENYYDADYDGCNEDPNDECGLLCDGCSIGDEVPNFADYDPTN